MINGASQIIDGVPGKYLDPLLLARSQVDGALGYIMIAYELHSTSDSSQLQRFYDLLFFRGSEIFECARINQDLRFQLHIQAALKTFKDHGRKDSTQISLFTVADEMLRRFLSTFYFEPCLKVQLEALSRKRIGLLLETAGCRRGIIECNQFDEAAPYVDLQELNSFEDIVQYRPHPKRGRLLLYDIEKNKELVSQRYSRDVTGISARPEPRQNSQQHGAITHHSTIPSFHTTVIPSFHPTTIPPFHTTIIPPFHLPDVQSLTTTDQDLEAIDEKEAEEITELIKQILNSPSTVKPDQKQVTERNQPSPSGRGFIITRQPQSDKPTTYPNGDSTRNAHPTKQARKRPQTTKAEPLTKGEGGTESTTLVPAQSNPDASSVRQEGKSATPTEYVRLFERLFRSFRQQLFDCFGDKSESAIAEAERKVRFLTPEFDTHSLNNETAVAMLDLIETITSDASFLKRTRLRQAALTLVADLYNKQYDVLEQYRAIDKVEQFYYRLKK